MILLYLLCLLSTVLAQDCSDLLSQTKPDQYLGYQCIADSTRDFTQDYVTQFKTIIIQDAINNVLPTQYVSRSDCAALVLNQGGDGYRIKIEIDKSQQNQYLSAIYISYELYYPSSSPYLINFFAGWGGNNYYQSSYQQDQITSNSLQEQCSQPQYQYVSNFANIPVQNQQPQITSALFTFESYQDPLTLGQIYLSNFKILFYYQCPIGCAGNCPGSVCSSCNTGYNLVGNSCQLQCLPGEYSVTDPDSSQQNCQPCISNCNQCSDSSTCNICKPGFGFAVVNGQIVNNQCQSCFSSCQTCADTNQSSCQSCATNYYALKNSQAQVQFQCVSICPNGYQQQDQTCLLTNQIVYNCLNKTCRSCSSAQSNTCIDCYPGIDLINGSCKCPQDPRNLNYYYCSDNNKIAVVQANFSNQNPTLTLEFGLNLSQIASIQCSEIFDSITLNLLGSSQCAINKSQVIVSLSQDAKIMANYTIGIDNNSKKLQFQGSQQVIDTIYFFSINQQPVSPQVNIKYDQIQNSCNDITFSIQSIQNDAGRGFFSIEWKLDQSQTFDQQTLQNLNTVIQNANKIQSQTLIIPKFTIPPNSSITVQLSYMLKVYSSNTFSFTTLNQKNKLISISSIQNQYSPLYRYMGLSIQFLIFTQECGTSGQITTQDFYDIQLTSQALPSLNKDLTQFNSSVMYLDVAPYLIPVNTVLDILVQVNISGNQAVNSKYTLSITYKLSNLQVFLLNGANNLQQKLETLRALASSYSQEVLQQQMNVTDQIGNLLNNITLPNSGKFELQGNLISLNAEQITSKNLQNYMYMINKPLKNDSSIYNVVITNYTSNPFIQTTGFQQYINQISNSTPGIHISLNPVIKPSIQSANNALKPSFNNQLQLEFLNIKPSKYNLTCLQQQSDQNWLQSKCSLVNSSLSGFGMSSMSTISPLSSINIAQAEQSINMQEQQTLSPIKAKRRSRGSKTQQNQEQIPIPIQQDINGQSYRWMQSNIQLNGQLQITQLSKLSFQPSQDIQQNQISKVKQSNDEVNNNQSIMNLCMNQNDEKKSPSIIQEEEISKKSKEGQINSNEFQIQQKGEEQQNNINIIKESQNTQKILSSSMLKKILIFHSFSSIFYVYDSKQSRAFRFVIFYLRVIHSLSISIIFDQKYNQEQVIMVSCINSKDATFSDQNDTFMQLIIGFISLLIQIFNNLDLIYFIESILAQNCLSIIPQNGSQHQPYQCIEDSTRDFTYFYVRSFKTISIQDVNNAQLSIDYINRDNCPKLITNQGSNGFSLKIIIDQSQQNQLLSVIQVNYEIYYPSAMYPDHITFTSSWNGKTYYKNTYNLDYIQSYSSQEACSNPIYKYTIFSDSFSVLNQQPQINSAIFTFESYKDQTSLGQLFLSNFQILFYYQCPIGCAGQCPNGVCSSCNTGYNLVGNLCQLQCPPGQISATNPNSYQQYCQPCISNCNQCSDYSTCNICNPGFVLPFVNGQIINTQCQSCYSSCQTCADTSQSSCQSCATNYYALKNSQAQVQFQCVSICPNGYQQQDQTCLLTNQIVYNCLNKTCRSCSSAQSNTCIDCYPGIDLINGSCKCPQDPRNLNYYYCSDNNKIAVVQANFSNQNPTLTLEFGLNLSQIASIQCSEIFDSITLNLLGSSQCAINKSQVIVSLSQDAQIMANYTIGIDNNSKKLQFQGSQQAIDTIYFFSINQQPVSPQVNIKYDQTINSCSDITFSIQSIENDAGRGFFSFQWQLDQSQIFDQQTLQNLNNAIKNANKIQSQTLIIPKFTIPPNSSLAVQLSYMLKVYSSNVISFTTFNQQNKQISISSVQNNYFPIYRYMGLSVQFLIFTQECGQTGQITTQDFYDIQLISQALPSLNKYLTQFNSSVIYLDVAPYLIPVNTVLDILVQVNISGNQAINSKYTLSIAYKLSNLQVFLLNGANNLVDYKSKITLIITNYTSNPFIQTPGFQQYINQILNSTPGIQISLNSVVKPFIQSSNNASVQAFNNSIQLEFSNIKPSKYNLTCLQQQSDQIWKQSNYENITQKQEQAPILIQQEINGQTHRRVESNIQLNRQQETTQLNKSNLQPSQDIQQKQLKNIQQSNQDSNNNESIHNLCINFKNEKKVPSVSQGEDQKEINKSKEVKINFNEIQSQQNVEEKQEIISIFKESQNTQKILSSSMFKKILIFHSFSSIFYVYDSKQSRAFRFTIYYLRIIHSLCISIIFDQKYNHEQIIMISCINSVIIIVSVEIILLVYKFRKIGKMIASLLIFGLLALYYYIILSIVSGQSPEQSNKKIYSFFIMFGIDFFGFSVILSLLSIFIFVKITQSDKLNGIMLKLINFLEIQHILLNIKL
ncbi:hypothetical protein ABPG74_018908 [Tetrahymena malaccensis]